MAKALLAENRGLDLNLFLVLFLEAITFPFSSVPRGQEELLLNTETSEKVKKKFDALAIDLQHFFSIFT